MRPTKSQKRFSSAENYSPRVGFFMNRKFSAEQKHKSGREKHFYITIEI